MLQEATVHTPAIQDGVLWEVIHAFEQEPQNPTLVWMLTQVVPHMVYPVLHVQTPDVQEEFDEQTLRHVPQLRGSEVKTKLQPEEREERQLLYPVEQPQIPELHT